jgi:hypothetical protein
MLSSASSHSVVNWPIAAGVPGSARVAAIVSELDHGPNE